MDDIWTEFQSFQSCQEKYITNVAGTVSGSYNDAAHSLARSTVGRAQCIASTFDLCEGAAGAVKGVSGLARDAVSSLGGRRKLSAGCAPTGFMRPVFGWAAPGKIWFPEVNMTIASNTQEVVTDIKDDISFLEDMAKWTRYAGWILAGVSVLLIVLTALYYTISGKVWKPSKYSYAFQGITLLRVVGAYMIALLVIFLQAYSTDKFCNVSIKSISLDAPACNVDEDCDFDCVTDTLTFPNTCEKCDIKLHWWWVEPFALPNVLAVIYLIFLVMVLVFEFVEARMEKKYASSMAAQRRVRSKVGKNDKKQKGLKESKGKVGLVGVGMKDSSENVLDGHAAVEIEESQSSDGRQPQTRYESNICIYPEKIYTGGLQ